MTPLDFLGEKKIIFPEHFPPFNGQFPGTHFKYFPVTQFRPLHEPIF
jgi:hypothetical protein